MSVVSAAVFSKAQLRADPCVDAPHATLKLALERMPGVKGAVMPDADHIEATARPDDVNARILAFWERSAG